MRAAFLPDASNLLCTFDLLKSVSNICLNLDSPYLHNENVFLKLYWSNRLLKGCYLVDFEVVQKVSEDFELVHNRMGYCSHVALKKTLDVDVPEGFTCYTCSRANQTTNKAVLSSNTIESYKQLSKFKNILKLMLCTTQ